MHLAPILSRICPLSSSAGVNSKLNMGRISQTGCTQPRLESYQPWEVGHATHNNKILSILPQDNTPCLRLTLSCPMNPGNLVQQFVVRRVDRGLRLAAAVPLVLPPYYHFWTCQSARPLPASPRPRTNGSFATLARWRKLIFRDPGLMAVQLCSGPLDPACIRRTPT